MSEGMDEKTSLNAEAIIRTIRRLENRIADRFPKSGLRSVCNQFLSFSENCTENINWIKKPNIPLRALSYLIITLGIGGVIYSVNYVELKIKSNTIGDIITISEAIFNDIILLGAAIYFMTSIELRVKRRKAIKALNKLRALVHVIDMHQLTKDPHHLKIQQDTANSPKRSMNKFELERYLDYCSEAAALVGKVAALYSESFPDEVVVNAVKDIESLSTGLSSKIWQKLMVLDNE